MMFDCVLTVLLCSPRVDVGNITESCWLKAGQGSRLWCGLTSWTSWTSWELLELAEHCLREAGGH